MGRRAGTAAVAIRPIEAGDAERVRRVLGVAFEDENRRMGMKQIRLPTMSDTLLSFYLTRSPGYSFVAAGPGGVIGFCLACRWGATAWLGPIAVLPPVQGQGLGRRLVAASEAALRTAGVTTLGLETMPRSYRNLQFYSRLGLRFEQMTLDLSRTFTAGGGSDAGVFGTADGTALTALGTLTPADRAPLLAHLTRISAAVSPGLDYRREAEATLAGGLGDVLVAQRDGGAIGFAIVHTRPYAREELPGTVRVNTLLLSPAGSDGEQTRRLEGFVDALGRRILEQGFDACIVRVPTRCQTVRDLLLRRGFTITHSDVRLTWPDLPERLAAGAVHLSKWE